MQLGFQLSEQDYMDFLLYSTSKSKKVTKRRSINKILLMAMYFITGMFLYNKNGPIASAVFFVACIPLYFLHSYMEKKQYRKHFTRFIREHFTAVIGKDITIDLNEDNLHIMDEEDTTLTPTDIEWIGETQSQVIIQSKAGKAFIIPKNKVEGVSAFVTRLKEIATTAPFPYNEELNWKWK